MSGPSQCHSSCSTIHSSASHPVPCHSSHSDILILQHHRVLHCSRMGNRVSSPADECVTGSAVESVELRWGVRLQGTLGKHWQYYSLDIFECPHECPMCSVAHGCPHKAHMYKYQKSISVRVSHLRRKISVSRSACFNWLSESISYFALRRLKISPHLSCFQSIKIRT